MSLSESGTLEQVTQYRLRYESKSNDDPDFSDQPPVPEEDLPAVAMYCPTVSLTTALNSAPSFCSSSSTTLSPLRSSKPLNGVVMNVRSLLRRSRNCSRVSMSDRS